MIVEFWSWVVTLGMHIPDNFLTLPVSLLLWLLTIACVGIAVRRTNAALDDRQVPMMGVMAACVFAAQMLNFPVAGGTSGHLLGGALAAIVLGPSSGILVMTCVVALQAILFQDGGLVVMGANIFNMGILTALVGGTLFRALLGVVGGRSWGLVVAGFISAMVSVVVASAFTALQLAASGSASAVVVLPAMIGVHSLIGIGEGLITAAALSFILATRPDLMPERVVARLQNTQRSVGRGAVLGVGLGVAVLLAVLSPFASSAPDGLERIAIDFGFLDTLKGPTAGSPIGMLPDYSLPGVGGGASTILAGLIGVVIVMALAYGIATTLNRRRPQRS